MLKAFTTMGESNTACFSWQAASRRTASLDGECRKTLFADDMSSGRPAMGDGGSDGSCARVAWSALEVRGGASCLWSRPSAGTDTGGSMSSSAGSAKEEVLLRRRVEVRGVLRWEGWSAGANPMVRSSCAPSSTPEPTKPSVVLVGEVLGRVWIDRVLRNGTTECEKAPPALPGRATLKPSTRLRLLPLSSLVPRYSSDAGAGTFDGGVARAVTPMRACWESRAGRLEPTEELVRLGRRPGGGTAPLALPTPKPLASAACQPEAQRPVGGDAATTKPLIETQIL
mmetsp:Transcript_3600/g.8962  ORF Transcript_3600/g.8962 Transcript_3600/m.8962 type:complete len:284 (+) Transcript_3600:1573-2424(+)